MIALALILLGQDPLTASGEDWARQPTSARCYVELSANMDDPEAMRDPEVRARVRVIAQQIAGAVSNAYYSIRSIQRDRVPDEAEAADLVANGLMSAEEAVERTANWDSALATYRTIMWQASTDYPACDFLGPLRQYNNLEEVMGTNAPRP